jgi:hypothetical protein
MNKLHVFGCSITQGFALPDVVKPLRDHQGRAYTPQEIDQLGLAINWEDIHVYRASELAWPAELGRRLAVPVINHARRGACFQQIARQCAVAAPNITAQDTVIVMWTYISRLSLQWPARTAVPFCNIVDPVTHGWKTVVLGFNKFFGLSRGNNTDQLLDQRIQRYIETATKETYLHPMGVFNQYYNNLVLQTMTDGFLRATGARVIHLSVEPERSLDQLEQARQRLEDTLKTPYVIPDPVDWYTLAVDHVSCQVILDPNFPTAENDMHPGIQHHANFAKHIDQLYFQQ